jgi:hypothetical protein
MVWTRIERSVLANGLLVHALPEEDAAGLHLRLLIPTEHPRLEISAAELNIIAGALRESLSRRTRGLHLRVATSAGPGRVELIVRANAKDASRVYSSLGQALGNEPSDKFLSGLLTRERKDHERIDTGEAASNALLSTLLGLSRSHFHSSAAEVDALTNASIRKLWRSFLNPRNCLLVVHGPQALAESSEALESLSNGWKSSGAAAVFAAPSESAVERIRPNSEKSRARARKAVGDRHLLGSPSAPIGVMDDLETPSRHPVVALGRIIPTPTAKDRALARLAQRVISQDSDLRLVVAGPISVLILRGRVSPADAKVSVTKAVAKLEAHANESFDPLRMQMAARLWLGARVVAASLEQEDWTGLYGEALDLANEDEEMGASLARDAQHMLEATPEELLEFTKRWFAPTSGEGGWSWWVAGVDDEARNSLDGLL